MLASVLAVVVIVVVMLPMFARPRINSRQLKDSTQVCGIQQAMVVFSQNNQDRYPLPSQLDLGQENQTAAGSGQEKDTTRNIFSILIYNNCFSPELCVSPSEVNPEIKIDTGYSYETPPVACGTSKAALWDPTFAAYPDDALASIKPVARKDGIVATGGLSYAHVPPFGGRSKMWANNFNANDAIVGNRGPTYTRSGDGWSLSTAAPSGGLRTAPPGTSSNTLRIHGGRSTWEGNIAYSDNHVNFETRADPDTLPFAFGAAPVTKTFNDNLFVAERNDSFNRDAQPDDLSTPAGLNGADNFLRGYVDVVMANDQVRRVVPFFD
ncbi:MAG: hypothetical protein SFY96_06355 [Planctomycetota bacterium]|nr:hypothetical protein [Planctomycetota bacterium]